METDATCTAVAGTASLQCGEAVCCVMAAPPGTEECSNYETAQSVYYDMPCSTGSTALGHTSCSMLQPPFKSHCRLTTNLSIGTAD